MALPRDPRHTRRWKKLRKQLLARHLLCERTGCGNAATDVHHLVPVMHDPAGTFWFDTMFLKCVCRECHQYIHSVGAAVDWKDRKAADDRGFGVG
jgi:hypothetical protein